MWGMGTPDPWQETAIVFGAFGGLVLLVVVVILVVQSRRGKHGTWAPPPKPEPVHRCPLPRWPYRKVGWRWECASCHTRWVIGVDDNGRHVWDKVVSALPDPDRFR